MVTRTGVPTRREQILKEAARLFAERGFHGVGVDEIGAAVGISGQLLEGGRKRVAAAGAGAAPETAGRADLTSDVASDLASDVASGSASRPTSGGAPDTAAGPTGAAPGTAAGSGSGTASAAEAALDSLIDGHIDFALDDRPLIVLHDRELGQLRDSDQKLVRQLQRQYVELWVGVVRQVYPKLPEPGARAAVHAVFGLLNSTPHLSRPRAQPSRAGTAQLLHRMARGAFASAAS